MHPGAQISGEVVLALGGKLAGLVEVCALPVDEVAEDETCSFVEEDGKYTIESLDSGAYLVVFRPSQPYASQYHPDASSFAEAQYVVTSAGSTTPNINASLTEGGRIKGQARDATTGTPVKDVFVCPEGIDGDRIAYSNCTQSDENGDYELKGMMPGDVRLSASDPRPGYTGQLYSNRYELLEADPLHVTEGAALTADFHLGRGGTISGQVISAFTKTPLPEVFVCASEPESLMSRDCETTDATGKYALEGLVPGSYTLEFNPDGETEYVAQYYSGKVVPAQSERIVIGPGSEVHANAALELGGSVSGVVSIGAGPTPIAGVVACAWFTAAEETSRCSETDSNGLYSIKGLAAGRYKIGFDDFFGHLNIAPSFYNGRGSYSEADEVTVTATHTTLGVNATVAQGAQIKGTVVDAETGKPVWGYEACAYETDGEEAGCSETDDSGAYAITGLRGGEYLVRFVSFDFSFAGALTRFGDQFYSHAPGANSAVPVAVPAGGVTSGINALLKASAVPVGLEHPEVVGTAIVGSTLGERHARWLNGVASLNGVPSLIYQWERCDASGGSCGAIAGASARHYTVVAADAGHRLRVSETAVNAHGPSQPEQSFRTAVVPTPSSPGGGPGPSPGGGNGNGNGNRNTGAPGESAKAQGGDLSTTSSLPSSSQILQALLASLVPTGKEARVAALRKHGAYKLGFVAPSAGQLLISWYQLPKGAHLSKAKSILLAVGTATTTRAGKMTIIVKLNPKGRAFLKHGRKPKLTAKGTFTPAGGMAVSATKTFTLH